MSPICDRMPRSGSAATFAEWARLRLLRARSADGWPYVDIDQSAALFKQRRHPHLRAFQISSTGQRRAHSGVASL